MDRETVTIKTSVCLLKCHSTQQKWINAVTTVINAVRLRLGVVNRTGKNHSIVKRLFYLDQFTAGLFDSKRAVELWFNVV